MNDDIPDVTGQQIAAKLDEALKHARPVVPLNREAERKEAEADFAWAEEEAKRRVAEVEQQNGERKVEHDRLTVEALVTKAWQERIRQVRGDVQPEIGARDIRIRELITRTLMTVGPDNADFAIGEFEKLA